MMQNSFKFLLICACLSLASQLIGCDQNASYEPLDNIDSETKDTKVTTFADQNDTEESDVQTVEDVPEDLSDESSQTDLTSATDLGSEDIEDIHDVELTDAHLDDASDTTPADIPSDTPDRPDTTSTDIPYDVVGIDSKDPSSEDAADSNPQDSIVAPDVIQVFSCGDGLVISPEVCDDGNAMDDGNGCSSTCQRNDVCGNALLETLYETCDDGNNNLSDDCPDGLGGTCQPAFCGDGFIWSGVEQCEQGAFAQSQCIDCEVICNDGFANCNQSFDDGCEIILASDPQSCGACGHNCGGGQCISGQCRPVLMFLQGFDVNVFIGSLLEIDNYLVYVANDQGWPFPFGDDRDYVLRMNKMAVCGWPYSYASSRTISALQTDTTDLFWINSFADQLIQLDLMEERSVVLIEQMGNANSYAVDYYNVYWIDPPTGQVKRLDRNSGIIDVFVQGLNQPRYIAIDNQYLYIFNSTSTQNTSELWRISRDTGEAIRLAQTSTLGPLLLTSDAIFWRNTQWPTTPRSIESVPIQGGPVTLHVASSLNAGVFAVDEQYIYWSSASGIKKLARDGSSEQVLLPYSNMTGLTGCSSASGIGPPNPIEMIVDDQFIYWVQIQWSYPYAILRLAK